MTRESILQRLRQIECDYNVRILHAVESGSRSWGFASPDSDWDVRFIYVHPTEWYMTVEPGRDVIEIMTTDGFDASGWELRKALGLFRRTNPSMLEWLHSPIVYLEREDFARTLAGFEPSYFNTTRGIYHYYRIAENHNERYLLKNGFMLKRFLYYLRSLLACRWIIERGTPPPVPFRELVEAMVADGDVKAAIGLVLEKKQRSKEHDLDTVPQLLTDYGLALSREVKAYLEGNQPAPPPHDRDRELDRLIYTLAQTAARHGISVG